MFLNLNFLMRNSRLHFPFSLVSLCAVAVASLAVVYIALIAIVMNYAALTVEFSQSVNTTEASVAILDSQYLSNVARIESLDYRTGGYVKPLTKIFVPAKSMTAVR